MKFYRFKYRLKDTNKVTGEVTISEPIVEWFGSEREAVVRRMELFKADRLAGKKKDNEIWLFEVPTDKLGLLAWLRKHCT